MDYEVVRRELSETPTAVCNATMSVSEIGAWIGSALASAAQAAAEQGAAIVGPPFARYVMLGAERFDVEAGFPVATAIEPAGDVRPSTLPGGPAAHTVHVGPYDAMGAAYAAVEEWIAAQGGVLSGPPWEVYMTDPDVEPDPAMWRTEVFSPYAA